MQVANCFAEWYIEPITCRRNFSEGQVIMNQKTIEADKSIFRNIQLEVIGYEDSSIDFDPPGQIFQISLSVPYEDGNILSNLQFIMETSDGGKFIGSGAGYVNKRVAGWKKHANKVTFAVSGENDAKVWAGWALGHEAATLTYPSTFRWRDDVHEL